jgi:hypothetical protein
MPNPATIATETIERRILFIRGHRVMLDATLAGLYGVATKVVNQAVKRNATRFPEDFAFWLTAAEREGTGIESGQSNRSQIVTGSQRYRDSRYLPLVFTEHGALMGANVLRSRRTGEMSVFLIRAFVKMREACATNAAVLKRLAEVDKTLLIHDSALRDLYGQLRPLLSPPPDPPKPKIGFHSDNK